MAHQADALGVDGMARQAQVVTQAEHTFKIVLRKLLIEQAHQLQVIGTLPARLVVEAAAREAQRLAAGQHRTARVRLGDQRALLDY
ncbi:hypothetical protein GCM10023172_29980 [Hymenobacter ginsengisoli]|uniref:Uncharacterized protein n=1 Tax=Hymenobacter ginsengisoli TaxID=1051626 RepID=A0ABP8QNP2_9BACT